MEQQESHRLKEFMKSGTALCFGIVQYVTYFVRRSMTHNHWKPIPQDLIDGFLQYYDTVGPSVRHTSEISHEFRALQNDLYSDGDTISLQKIDECLRFLR
jgi:hypothetical protein